MLSNIVQYVFIMFRLRVNKHLIKSNTIELLLLIPRQLLPDSSVRREVQPARDTNFIKKTNVKGPVTSAGRRV